MKKLVKFQKGILHIKFPFMESNPYVALAEVQSRYSFRKSTWFSFEYDFNYGIGDIIAHKK